MFLTIADNYDKRPTLGSGSKGVFKAAGGLHEYAPSEDGDFIDIYPPFKPSRVQRLAKFAIELNNQKVGELPAAEFIKVP